MHPIIENGRPGDRVTLTVSGTITKVQPFAAAPKDGAAHCVAVKLDHEGDVSLGSCVFSNAELSAAKAWELKAAVPKAGDWVRSERKYMAAAMPMIDAYEGQVLAVVGKRVWIAGGGPDAEGVIRPLDTVRVLHRPDWPPTGLPPGAL